MVIMKRGLHRNNQADHISFNEQAQQAAVLQIICCYVIDETITMHYSIIHVIANCGDSQNFYVQLNYAAAKHLLVY